MSEKIEVKFQCEGVVAVIDGEHYVMVRTCTVEGGVCSFCGQKMEPRYGFCPNCGALVQR